MPKDCLVYRLSCLKTVLSTDCLQSVSSRQSTVDLLLSTDRLQTSVSPHPQVAIEGQDESWDFGSSAGLYLDASNPGHDDDDDDDDVSDDDVAGFYVDATTPAWSKHYNMYSYITGTLETVE